MRLVAFGVLGDDADGHSPDWNKHARCGILCDGDADCPAADGGHRGVVWQRGEAGRVGVDGRWCEIAADVDDVALAADGVHDD